MTNVSPVPARSAGYETAERISNVLNVLSWLVILVGVVNAVLVLIAGFNAAEPWTVGGYAVDDDWKSVSLGVFGAAAVLLYAGVVWSLIQAVRLVVRYVGGRPLLPE